MINELVIKRSFIEFLTNQKGYPTNCFIEDHEIHIGSKTYKMDLILIEPEEIKRLGLIEFVSQINTNNLQSHAIQINSYKNLVEVSDIPSYIVSLKESKFQIYQVFGDLTWVEINENDFPLYKYLANRIIAKEKLRTLETSRHEIENKINNQRNKAITSLLAIFVAITGGIISIFNISDSYKLSKSDSNKILTLVDSLKKQIENNYQYTDQKISDFKNFFQIIDTLRNNSILNSNFQIKNINTELIDLKKENLIIKSEFKKLNELLFKDPSNIITLNDLKTDITLINKDLDNEIKLLQNDLKALSDKYDFIMGGLITIIASILILALPNLFQWNRK